jgi:hypothetical protein
MLVVGMGSSVRRYTTLLIMQYQLSQIDFYTKYIYILLLLRCQ